MERKLIERTRFFLSRGTSTVFSASKRAGQFFQHNRKNIQKISIPTITVLLIVGMMLMMSPKNGLKAQNYNKVWTSTADFNAGTNSNIDTSSDQSQLATSTTAFSEGFTATTNKDGATDANWDTTAHSLSLPGDPTNGTTTDLQAKWKSAVGAIEDITATIIDNVNGIIYIGGNNGSLGAYKISDQSLYSLTSKISTNWSTDTIYSFAIDTANGVLYLGGTSAKFGAYSLSATPSGGTWTYLNSKITANWGTNSINAMAFDTLNGFIYLGGTGTTFGAYAVNATPSSGTFTYLNSKITADWGANSVKSMTFDTTNNLIYIGGSNAKFGAFLGGATPSAGTWTYLWAKLNAAGWSIYGLFAMSFDTANKIVYFSGETGQIGAFSGAADPANGTFTSLGGKTGAWGLNNFIGMTYDSTNSIIYTVGLGGRFAAMSCNGTPSSDTFTYLTAKVSTDVSTNQLNTVIFNSSNGLVYMGGAAARFGSFAGGATPSAGTWTYMASNIAGILFGTTINSSAYDSINGILYVGGNTGQLMSYKISDGTATGLTSKIASDWGANEIQAMTFDSTNGIIYLGSANGKFAAYAGGSNPSAGTYTSLTSKISSDWSTNQVQSMSFDSTNGIVYLSGQSGKFGSYVGGATPANGTYTTLGAKLSDWAGSGVPALAYDLANGILYLGGRFGHFGAFVGGATPSAGTYTSLTSKISADWSTSHFDSLAFDTANGKVYLGSDDGKFGAFTGGATPSTGTWAYLTTKISADWSTNAIYSLAYVGGKIFLGGNTGKFGFVTALSTASSDVWTNLTTNVSATIGTNANYSLFYVPTVVTVYVGSANGKFTSFMIGYSSNKNGLSTKLNSTTQTIYKATLTATDSKPTNTAITYYLSNDGGSHWNLVTSGVEYTFTLATSDLRWKATLTTTDASVTPSITAIAISYKYLTSNTGTMDLIFDATSAVTPTLLSWNDTLPTNTAMTVKIRTSSTSPGLSAATWSDTKNAADTPVNLKTINVGGVTGALENEFSEVYITLTTSDGLGNPILSDLTEQYVINQPPQIQTLTASQVTDGSKVVNIAYQLKDPDTSTNPYNANQVTVTFQYSLDSGSTWNTPATITNAGLRSVNSDGSWTNQTAVWNVGTDLANSYYNNTVEIRVNANDNEQAHNTASLDSSAFSIDTKSPVANAISGGGVGVKINDGTAWTNSSTVTLTLSATDDAAKYMEIRNDQSFTGAEEAYAISKSNYSLSATDGNKTVYVRFYDAYGNYADANANVLLDTTSPDLPQHFTIFDTSDQQAGTFSSVVVWNPVNNPGDFSQYIIERSTDGSTWDQLATYSNIASNAYSDMGLSNSITYSYRMRTEDIHNNYSSYTSVASLKPAGTDTVPPTITGTGPTPEAQDTTATISWTTDKPSDSYVEYGTTTNYGSIQGADNLVVNHVVNLVGLNPTTTYQFRVKCRDASGNRVVSSNQSFTTTLPADASVGVSITGATAQKPGADPEEVTIIWTTDKYSTSQVVYGTTQTLDMATTADATLNKTHYVAIAHLNPNTKYYYQAKSIDTYGNTVLGEIKYFVTAQTGLGDPTIKDVVASDLTMTSAIVSWTTATVSTSIVEYGAGDNYTDRIDDQSSGAITQHVIRLTNLTQGTTYHFRVMGQGSDGRYTASDDYKFATISLPGISAISVSEISSIGAKVTFKTNVPTDANVDFGSENSNLSQGSGTITTDHEVSLFALKPATKYSYTIRVRDNFGNSVTSGTQTFQTVIDTTPPKIKDMKSEVSIVTDQDGNSKAQVIVSWSTDEPATGQVKYALGVADANDYPLSTTEDTNLTTSHVVIIANLSTSATYHMKLLSKDSSGNLAVSDDYSVITLNQQKTLLEYIIQILQNRFSWLSNLGFLQ